MNLQVSDVYLSPNGRDGTYSRVNASYDHSSVHEVGYQSDLSGLDLTSLGLGFAIAVFTFSVIFLVLLSRFQIQPRSPRKGSTKKSDSKNEIIDDSDIPDNSIINTYSEIREEDENIKLKNLFKNEIEELKNEIEELKKTQTNKIENEVQRLFSNYRSSLGSTNELHSDVSYSEDKDGSHQRLDKSNNSEMRQPVNNRINDEIQILVKDYCCAEISDYSKVREDFLYKYKQEYRGRFYNFGLKNIEDSYDNQTYRLDEFMFNPEKPSMLLFRLEEDDKKGIVFPNFHMLSKSKHEYNKAGCHSFFGDWRDRVRLKSPAYVQLSACGQTVEKIDTIGRTER